MTWVDDQHVGCVVGDAADHGWCRKQNRHVCTWCGHAGCQAPRVSALGPWTMGMFEVLTKVAQERERQMAQYGDNADLEDGTSPGRRWLAPYSIHPASAIQHIFRKEYEVYSAEHGLPTWMHLVREEVAEAFQESDPARLAEELIQVAALCVSWVETLNRRNHGADTV